jgi:preprotein translocase subunit YajC
MLDLVSPLLLLAKNAPAPRGGGNELYGMLLPMVAIAFLWYFLLLRPQRKEQSRRQDLLSALKKNDRVVTIGGILGTVVTTSADGKEVTLKVDDNTRLRMLRSSIQSVLKDDEPGETPAKT